MSSDEVVGENSRRPLCNVQNFRAAESTLRRDDLLMISVERRRMFGKRVVGRNLTVMISDQ